MLLLQIPTSIMANSGNEIPKKKLKILSWNIFMLPSIVPREGRIERAHGIVDTLKKTDYDIIVFQEAFHKKAVKVIDKGLSENYPFKYGPFNKTNLPLNTNSGVWILSKTPLDELGVVKYRDAKGIDKMAHKGAALLRGFFNGKEFQILGTHMQAGYSKYAETRKRQLMQIENELLQKNRKSNVPQILCGDMNVERSVKDEYHFMIEQLNAEDGEIITEQKETYDSKINPLADPNTTTTFDYILLRKNGAKINVLERAIHIFKGNWKKGKDDLSDHFGLTCEIEF
jgi:endonuclease/exonuclease/phosphatase family metal-dependent hydrolase